MINSTENGRTICFDIVQKRDPILMMRIIQNVLEKAREKNTTRVRRFGEGTIEWWWYSYKWVGMAITFSIECGIFWENQIKIEQQQQVAGFDGMNLHQFYRLYTHFFFSPKIWYIQ